MTCNPTSRSQRVAPRVMKLRNAVRAGSTTTRGSSITRNTNDDEVTIRFTGSCFSGAGAGVCAVS